MDPQQMPEPSFPNERLKDILKNQRERLIKKKYSKPLHYATIRRVDVRKLKTNFS